VGTAGHDHRKASKQHVYYVSWAWGGHTDSLKYSASSWVFKYPGVCIFWTHERFQHMCPSRNPSFNPNTAPAGFKVRKWDFVPSLLCMDSPGPSWDTQGGLPLAFHYCCVTGLSLPGCSLPASLGPWWWCHQGSSSAFVIAFNSCSV
jgi:hypothetical protein